MISGVDAPIQMALRIFGDSKAIAKIPPNNAMIIEIKT